MTPLRRFHPANFRSAFWALRAARRTRRGLAQGGLDAALGPPPPPPLPGAAERGVRAALRRSGQTCLVSSIVIQSWDAAHGRPRDLVIGVTGRTGFRAHAWLEGDRVPTPLETDLELEAVGIRGAGDSALRTNPSDRPGFHELLRRPAPTVGSEAIDER